MSLIIGVSFIRAQDTLLYEGFNDTIDPDGWYLNTVLDFPPGINNDTLWYDYDEDGNSDANGRPAAWYMSLNGGFTYPDTTDGCLMASSWFTPFAQASNWLFTPAIQITDGASAWLKWRSAPRQTPYFLDGYEVFISTTTNDYQTAFTDLVYTAAEYTAGATTLGGDFSSYTFSTPGFIHGLDGNFITFDAASDGSAADTTVIDSARYKGVQRLDSVSLAAYDNMIIYIAFHHNSDDDNLISIDDILVTENTDPTFSIDPANNFDGQVYPNPASDFINVKFNIEQYHNARVEMVNSNGQTIYTAPLTTMHQKIDVSNVAGGVYFVKIKADEGSMVEKVIVNH
jgi:hypothetical protein